MDASNYDGNGNAKTAVIVLMSKTTTTIFCSLGPRSALGKKKKKVGVGKKKIVERS